MSLNRHSRIIPTMQYENAQTALEWLCQAFGFERQLVITNDAGRIVHAQLTYGAGMIMLGDNQANEAKGDHQAFGQLQQPIAQVGGIATQSAYVIVQDVDAHYARAVEAGAKIVMPLCEPEQGGKAYSCKDPQGQLWNIGSYDPWGSVAG